MEKNPLTPRQIVEELDKYIVGQEEAKRAVAIALRNRYRRRQLSPDLQEEVIPKNILMIGSTGIGKTEIARRLARLANAPYVKVEATKFTEVGYVGRDVDSMIRDLTDVAIRMVEEEKFAEVHEEASRRAVERILDSLEPSTRRKLKSRRPSSDRVPPLWLPLLQNLQESLEDEEEEEERETESATRHRQRVERIRDFARQRLLRGELDSQLVEIEVEENRSPVFNIWSGAGEEVISMQDALGGFPFPKQRSTRKVSVAEAREILTHEEAQKLIDRDTLVREAIHRVEQDGIVFLDELDKIAGREAKGHGPDVSREGVQRDILPVVEGSTVMTKYGPVNTAHILFIAAGAFHVSKPSDLIPELQGRFPIRVELKNLTKEDLKLILVEPRNALIRQYTELLRTEGVTVEFTDEAIDEIADIAVQVNDRTENIGARRLHTIMEKLLDELSFAAPEVGEQTVTITREYVRQRLADIVADEDLSRYIL